MFTEALSSSPNANKSENTLFRKVTSTECLKGAYGVLFAFNVALSFTA